MSAAFFLAGAEALHEDGEQLITHVADAGVADAIEFGVRHADPGVRVERTEVPTIDWSVAWRTGVTVHQVGALRIAPPWLADGLDPATTIVIDPAMAFGTGDHPTTRGVLRLMQGAVRPGDVVADVGAGSGVLAIAAAKLGASRVAAIEMDPDAIGNAEENVARNGVAAQVRVIEGDATVVLPLVAPVRVVFANIISSVIVQLLPVIGTSLARGGVAIFSGMLYAERGEMVRRAGEAGWEIEAEDVEGEWWSFRAFRLSR